MKSRIKTAVIQMDCVPFDKEKNLGHAEELIAGAAAAGAEFIVLPELFSTGYRVEEKDAVLAEPVPGPTTEWMQGLAGRYGVCIAGAVMESCGGSIYDTAVIAGPEGLAGRYRKMHLWGTEPERFRRGCELPVFSLPFGRIGLQICYEIGFPEQARVLALKGAQIIVYTSAFGKARDYAWNIASRSRALENGVYVVACNRTGIEKDTVFGGLSRIVAPDSRVIAGTECDGEAVICAEIDLAEIEEQRKRIPYLRDLNKGLIIKGF